MLQNEAFSGDFSNTLSMIKGKVIAFKKREASRLKEFYFHPWWKLLIFRLIILSLQPLPALVAGVAPLPPPTLLNALVKKVELEVVASLAVLAVFVQALLKMEPM